MADSIRAGPPASLLLPAHKPRIVIGELESGAAKLFVRQLRGFNVTLVRDERNLLKQVAAERFDAAIIGFLPSKYELSNLARLVKEASIQKPLPLIWVTARYEPVAEGKIDISPFFSLVQVPYDSETLVAALENSLQNPK